MEEISRWITHLIHHVHAATQTSSLPSVQTSAEAAIQASHPPPPSPPSPHYNSVSTQTPPPILHPPLTPPTPQQILKSKKSATTTIDTYEDTDGRSPYEDLSGYEEELTPTTQTIVLRRLRKGQPQRRRHLAPGHTNQPRRIPGHPVHVQRRGTLAIALALETHSQQATDNITICADSTTAINRTWELSKGHPCNSGIEVRIKDALQNCLSLGLTVYLCWVRAHIGIHGNQTADRMANAQSWKGDILRLPTTATPGGITAHHKAIRKQWRSGTSYGLAHSNYNSKALAAYTQLRTEKGPQRSWLHKIGKSDHASCQCGHTPQIGHHIAFHCPRLHNTRLSLIGHRQEWADLDAPIYIQTGPEKEDIIEGGEEWFTTLFHLIS